MSQALKTYSKGAPFYNVWQSRAKRRPGKPLSLRCYGWVLTWWFPEMRDRRNWKRAECGTSNSGVFH